MGASNREGAATAAPSRLQVLEEHGRIYGDLGLAIAFTAGVAGDDAKRVLAKGWPETKPLPDAEYGAGLLGNRGVNRNPVVVLRASGLVGIEADSAEDIATVEALSLPETVTVRSSADTKRHWYFRAPGKLGPKDAVAFRFEKGRLGADAGRYFVCPPAIHPNGETYRFLNAPGAVEIPEMPLDTYRWLTRKAAQQQGERREQIHAAPDAKIPEGSDRHGAVVRYARAVCNWSSNLDVVLASARAWNEAHCDPPISDSEVVRSVTNMVEKYARGEAPALDKEVVEAGIAEYIAGVNDSVVGDVDGAELLDELVTHFSRYMVMTESQTYVVSLFTVMTYCVKAFTVVPYLRVDSPTKRTGKSRLLELLEFAVQAPLKTGGVSEAALFRSLSDGTRTLLFDEIGAVLGEEAGNKNLHSDIGAVLLNGFSAGTPVIRCIGQGSHQEVVLFDVFGPKVLGGKGQLNDMITDRCLPIALKRKSKGEQVERWRRRHADQASKQLRLRMAIWAKAHLDELARANPDLPEQLDDRAQDISEPLFAIADAAGGDWPQRARRAVIELRGSDADADDDVGVALLTDIRKAFDTDPDVERLPTETLILTLCEDAERSWKTWSRGEQITPRALSGLLRTFGIKSSTIRFPDGLAKGYKREQFEDTWERYLSLPPGGPFAVTPVTTALPSGLSVTANPPEQADVTPVTEKCPHGGGEEEALLDDVHALIQEGVIEPPASTWTCPCGTETPGAGAATPAGTVVSIREPKCPFCDRKYKPEYRSVKA
jgi:hypothetical protein